MAYFGASCDAPEKNKEFADKLELNFPLLSDPDQKAALAYGIAKGKRSQRVTIIVDREGKIAHLESEVQVRDHGAQLVHLLKKLNIPPAPQDKSEPDSADRLPPEPFEAWPLEVTIGGRILIDAGAPESESLGKWADRWTSQRRLALVGPAESDLAKRLAASAEEAGADDVKAERERLSYADLNDERLRQLLQTVDVLYLGPTELAPDTVRRWRDLEDSWQGFFDRQGMLVVDAAVAPAFGKQWIRGDLAVVPGLNLIPDGVLAIDPAGAGPAATTLSRQLADFSPCVGLVVPPQTCVMLDGRKLVCFGEGSATVCLPTLGESLENSGDDASERLVPVGQSSASAGVALLDWTQWRRRAMDRHLDPFPPAEPPVPFVPHGTLVIVGGGGMPSGLMEQMIEMAGGKDEARLVYIPCSESEEVGPRQSTVEMWKRMGVKHATFVHTKDRRRANEDEAILAPLREATMLWFGGGRQWNFSDSYYGTEAHRLMKQVLERGGVIGGSSAGASIQARYLARATPIGNLDIMAPGYERGGLGFIGGVAIDQHFSQRKRQADMSQLVDRYPQLLGIGIDETTALLVRQSQAEVVGPGRVFFYDRRQPRVADQPDYVALSAGGIYDLARRVVVRPGAPPESRPAEDASQTSVLLRPGT